MIKGNTLYLPYDDLSSYQLAEKIRELLNKEEQMFRKIEHLNKLGRDIDNLLQQRDDLLELLVVYCTRLCAQKYWHITNLDILVFFKTVSIFTFRRPHIKI